MSNNNQVPQVDSTMIPTPDDALLHYQSLGGEITVFNSFGEDPLKERPDLIADRERQYGQCYPNFDEIFYTTVNGNYVPFQNGLLGFITISKQLELQL